MLTAVAMQAGLNPASSPAVSPLRSVPRWRRFTRWGASALLVVWGAFWGWFVGAHLVGEWPASIWPAGALLVAVVATAVTALRWPRHGGALALAFGGFALWRFWAATPGVLAAWAGVPMIAGAALLLAGRAR